MTENGVDAPDTPVVRYAMPGSEMGPHRIARLARNAVANLLRIGAAWLVVLIVPPILVRTLSQPEYATWMLILQLTAYTTLFDGALQMAVSRFVARASGDDNRALLGETLSSIALLFVAAAAVVLVAIVLLSLAMPDIFHSIPSPLLSQAKYSLLIVGGSLAIVFPACAMAGLSLGLEKNHINAVAGSVSKLLGAAGTVWAALHHQGLVTMALWTGLGIFALPAIYIWATVRQGLWSLFSPALVRAQRAWEFARFCSASVASQLTVLLISGLDIPIVAAFDFKNAGYYAVALTASNMVVVPYGAVLSTLVPMISAKSAGESPKRMGEILLRTTRLSTALLALIAVPLMIGMPVLLKLWVGAAYAKHTLVLGELLTAALLVRFTLNPYALIGFSAGEQNKMLVSPALESGVNLACSLVLVRYLGAEGVALGTLIGVFVGVAMHFWNSMRRTKSMAFSKTHLLFDGIVRPLCWALPIAVFGASILPLVVPTAAKLLLLAALSAILAFVFWKAILKPEDRAAFRVAGGHFLPVLSRAQG